MTHVLIDLEVVKAIGLSVAFMGVMLSIVSVGISFLICKLSKQKAKQYLKMVGLITAWAVYISLNLQFSAESDYVAKFFIYSTAHIISILIGSATIIVFLFMLPDFWKKKIFDRKLLIIVGIIAVLAILMSLTFPFFRNPYLGLLNRITMIIPPLLGFFMIIKSYIGEKTEIIKKRSRELNILVLGMIVVILLSLCAVWQQTTGKAIVVTGDAISKGDLKGLEIGVFVPEKYQKIQAGEMLQFQISLKNIEKVGRHDIQLDYYIKKNEITISHRRELKAVETQASFLASIKVPEETLPGIYNIEVEINEEESSMATFYVKSSEVGQIRMYLILLITAIIVVGGMISWQLHKLTKRR